MGWEVWIAHLLSLVSETETSEGQNYLLLHCLVYFFSVFNF